MQILYFAQIKQLTNKSEQTLRVASPISVAQLWDGLILEYPGLEEFRQTTRLARNCEYVSDSVLLHDEDEVALIPPVSGG